MLHKILDNFDIDPYGWFEPANDSTDYSFILPHCSDIWSLWVKQPTNVEFTTVYVPNSALRIGRHFKALTESDWYTRLKPPTVTPEHITNIIKDHLLYNQFHTLHTHDPASIYRPSAVNRWADYYAKHPKDFTPTISVPGNFLSPDVIKKVNDWYLLSDAAAAYGLEDACRNSNLIAGLDFDNLSAMGDLSDHYILPCDPTTNLVPPRRIIASCVFDIHNAAVIRNTRAHILDRWPGWADLFTAKDAVCLVDTETIAATVRRASKHRSELRRFCIALAWNINAPHDQRVPFPRGFQAAYATALTEWEANIAPHLNSPGKLIVPILNLVNNLATILKTEEIENKKSRAPEHGSDFTQVDNNTLDKSKIRARKNGHNISEAIKPRAVATDTSNNTDIAPPAVFYHPSEWSRMQPDDTKRDYANTSKTFMDKVRSNIADRISAASWFVPQPPPLDPGHLNGQLDESALTDLVAFNDQAIFLNSPDLGHGSIAMCILVDGSGSMSQQFAEYAPDPEQPGYSKWHTDPQTFMQEALAMVAGMRDALSRPPNIHLIPFTYSLGPASSDLTTETPWLRPPSYVSDGKTLQSMCCMVPITSEEDFLHLKDGGATPTSTAIQNAHEMLQTNYPNSTHIILVLTDGAPCGTVGNPFEAKSSHGSDGEPLSPDVYTESIEAVTRVIKSISTPVFCVTYGRGDHEEKDKQYNPGHHFCVARPLDVIDVACNLITGIGQSISR